MAMPGEVKQDLRILERTVSQAVEGAPDSIAEIRSVLHQASDAVRTIRSSRSSGAYSVSVDPSHRSLYFPSVRWERRCVSAEEMREANAAWEAALERGRRHQHEAFESIGPFLTPRQASDRLGVSRVTVNNWRRRGKLLALRFDDHQYVYPAFQFSESPAQGENGLLRHLDEILPMLPTDSPWVKAKFFLTGAPALDGRTPLELLRMGRAADVERVRRYAPHMGEMGT